MPSWSFNGFTASLGIAWHLQQTEPTTVQEHHSYVGNKWTDTYGPFLHKIQTITYLHPTLSDVR